jgi:hypothetical protein
MAGTWYYQHEGKTFGPVASEEMRDLARRGLLHPHDLIWPEGGNLAGAISADAAVDFAALGESAASGPPVPARATPASKLPDWLEDVAALEKTDPGASRRKHT